MIKLEKLVFKQITLLQSALVALVLVLAVLLAAKLTPTIHTVNTVPDFETIIPKQFGDWKQFETNMPQVSLSTGKNDLVNQIYDSVVTRTYISNTGEVVMLAIAYALEQKQDIKIHRPEVCYVAQGLPLIQSNEHLFNSLASKQPVIGKQLLFQREEQYEAVSYWIRVGNATVTSGSNARLKILKDGLFRGLVDDGVLVRVSSLSQDKSKLDSVYDVHEKFLKSLLAEMGPKHYELLVP